jgi:hypothetical protein
MPVDDIADGHDAIDAGVGEDAKGQGHGSVFGVDITEEADATRMGMHASIVSQVASGARSPPTR